MASAAGPIQTGVYAALTGDATLMGLITGIFDAVPDDQGFPYVTLGEVEMGDFSTFGRLGEACVLTIHTWSQDKGSKVTQAIQSRIDTLLNRQGITVTGFTFVSCLREFATVMRDPDGVTWHGVQRFRVHVTA